jgi:hypothetical protein
MDSDLDDLFARARAESPQPPAGLLARIEADALAVHKARQPAAPARRSRWAGWVGALGGNGVLAGLATATLAGLWLGFAQPAPVSALTTTVSQAFGADSALDSVELIPALDTFGAEG